ncbi:MAG: hypothetical protein HY866_00175 [Chloroflexi bacterium]|nr:hypothetical protein [Chloroflexota bacterium]
MKVLRALSLLFAVVMFISIVPVGAQTDELWYWTFPDGVTVAYPTSWEATPDDDEVIRLESENTALYLYLYSLSDLAEIEVEPGDTLGLLEYYHTYNLSEGEEAFAADQIVTTTVDGREISYFEPLMVDGDDEYQRLRGSMLFDDTGRMVAFGAFPFEEAAVSEKDTVFEIIASAETGVYYLNDGTFFTYPPAWDSYTDDDGYIRLDNGDTNIRMEFYSPETLEEMGTDSTNLVAVLEDAFTSANDKSLTFDTAAVVEFTAGDYPGMQYSFTDTYETESYERLLVVTASPDGWVNLFDIAPAETTINEEDKAIVIDILASFEPPVE